MVNSPLDILYILYLGITESFYIKVFLLTLIYACAYIYKLEGKNWYAYQNQEFIQNKKE